MQPHARIFGASASCASARHYKRHCRAPAYVIINAKPVHFCLAQPPNATPNPSGRHFRLPVPAHVAVARVLQRYTLHTQLRNVKGNYA